MLTFFGQSKLLCLPSLLPRYLNNDYQDKIFILKNVTESNAIFEHQPLFASSQVVNEQLDSLKKWRLTKKEPTMMCPQQLCTARLPHNVDFVKKDIEKAVVSHLLMEAYMSNKLDDDSLLGFAAHPSNLFLMKKVKKKELKLYPIGTCSAVPEKDQAKTLEKTKNVVVWFNKRPYLIQPFKNLTSFTKPETGTLCPFFWVKSSEKQEEINLQTAWVTHKGLQIPILENDDPIQAQAILLKSSGQQPQGPPAKKARST